MASRRGGVAQREHFLALAKSTNAAVRAKALAMLTGPECPAEFAYLRDWLMEFYDPDVGFWRAVEPWMAGTQIRPTEDEFAMLRALFGALRTAASEARDAERATERVTARAASATTTGARHGR